MHRSPDGAVKGVLRMFAAIHNRTVAAVCAALLLWPVGPPLAAQPGSLPTSVTALQAEFLRRVNMAEPVFSLFDSRARVPDVSGWRSITLLEPETAMQAGQMLDTDNARTRLHARVRRQAPFTSDCPVVDELLIETGENMWVWDELGWIEITYRRAEAGWRIAGVDYRPEEEPQ
jgi:hypothetical protein